MTQTTTPKSISSSIEEIFAGSKADVDLVKAFFRVAPNLRSTAVNTDDYVLKAAKDDILKDILTHVSGYYHTLEPWSMIGCINRNKIMSPSALICYVNTCLYFIETFIIQKGLVEMLPYLKKTKMSLEPVLDELTK